MKIVLITLFSAILFIGQAQSLDKSARKKLDQLMNEQLAEKKAPGLAIGIVQGGKIIYESYAGYADLKKDIKLGKESRFNYASSGKQFTALAILKLVEDGSIKLEDDIRKFLPDFYPNVKEKIQIQHLLTHTSGIRDVYELWNLKGITWWEETLGNADAFELLSKQQQLSFTPGERYIYSNSNYLLLTEIVNQVTGQSFKTYSDNLFEGLGMSGTAFEPNHEDIDKRVLPYGFWKKYRMYEWNADLIGDGALFTTLPDQLAWEAMIQQKNAADLSSETIEKSQSPIPSSSIESYGYGLELEENRSFHHGSTGAYGATFSRFSKDQLSIVVMTNYTNISASTLANKCYEILVGSAFSQLSPRSPQTIGSFVSVESLLGTYKTPFGYYYRFVTRSDTLFLERTNREPVALEHEEGNIYHEINDPDFQLEFTTDPDLGMQITAYYPTHDSYTLTREEIQWEGYNYRKLNGTYYNAELEVSLIVEYMENDQYQVKYNDRERNIQLFEPDVLWIDGYKVEARGSEEQATELLISGSRNRNILFTKSNQ